MSQSRIIVAVFFAVVVLIDALTVIMFHDPVLFVLMLILTLVVMGMGALLLYAPALKE
jgi:NADH:ubiquinone oxidoreductase subunit 6 (subunit J)